MSHTKQKQMAQRPPRLLPSTTDSPQVQALVASYFAQQLNEMYHNKLPVENDDLLPLARIKRIMKQDSCYPYPRMVCSESVTYIAFATRIFIGMVVSLSSKLGMAVDKRNTLQCKDIKKALELCTKLDFLVDAFDQFEAEQYELRAAPDRPPPPGPHASPPSAPIILPWAYENMAKSFAVMPEQTQPSRVAESSTDGSEVNEDDSEVNENDSEVNDEYPHMNESEADHIALWGAADKYDITDRAALEELVNALDVDTEGLSVESLAELLEAPTGVELNECGQLPA